MRLVRFGAKGKEKPGILTGENTRIDLSGHFADWNAAFFAGDGLQKLADVFCLPGRLAGGCSRRQSGGALPLRVPGKVICIGLNYSDHAKESGMPVPEEPIVFLKAANTVVGPYDDVLIPRTSVKTDWEVELGVVIGREASYVASIEAAAAHIGGYCVSHDVSERAFQLERGGQWTKGKSCDTFNPLGPWLATPDEIADPANLAMSLSVNGESKQRGNTSTMIFNPAYLIHYLSQFMTLEPGDLISTGTPPGVGLGFKPPQYLKAGDVVDLEIEGLGSQRQVFANA